MLPSLTKHKLRTLKNPLISVPFQTSHLVHQASKTGDIGAFYFMHFQMLKSSTFITNISVQKSAGPLQLLGLNISNSNNSYKKKTLVQERLERVLSLLDPQEEDYMHKNSEHYHDSYCPIQFAGHTNIFTSKKWCEIIELKYFKCIHTRLSIV